MQLIAPDLLADARELSLPVLITGQVVGLLLYVLGWRAHRFWIVVFTTVIAGVIGLSSGRTAGVQPFVAGLLLAIAAGTMALALARVAAFLAAGAAGWLLVASVMPSWDGLIAFLVSGLVGLFFFRECMMILTSLGGTLLMLGGGLALADRLGRLDAQAWSEQRGLLLNGVVLGMALLGLGLQFFLERWLDNRQRLREAAQKLRKAEDEFDKKCRGGSWLTWWRQQRFRRAA